MLVKARLRTAGGSLFVGYVIESVGVFAVGVLINGEHIIANLNIRRSLDELESVIRDKVGDSNHLVFPLQYETAYVLRDDVSVCGKFGPQGA